MIIVYLIGKEIFGRGMRLASLYSSGAFTLLCLFSFILIFFPRDDFEVTKKKENRIDGDS